MKSRIKVTALYDSDTNSVLINAADSSRHAFVSCHSKDITYAADHIHEMTESEFRALKRAFSTREGLPLNVVFAVGKTGGIFPSNLVRQINAHPHFAQALADLAFRVDLSSYAAVIHVGKEHRSEANQIEIPKYLSFDHLTKSWFGFPSLDDAMVVRLLYASTTVIPLHESD